MDKQIADNYSINLETIVSLYDKIGIGIYVLDKNGIVVYVNDYFVALTGHTKEYYKGFRMWETIGSYGFSVSKAAVEAGRPVTAFQDVRTSIRAYRQFITVTPVFNSLGEIEYLVAELEAIEDHAARFNEASRNKVTTVLLGNSSQSLPEKVKMIAESSQMKELVNIVKMIAPTDSSILIEGESGTGKEVMVQFIHSQSKRHNHELVAINCASLPEQLLEAELFGYDKGAFTGASATGKKGLIEEATGGTLFLDEINSMPLSIQSKLLRVLETKKLRHVGGTKEIKVDFRLISATNANLRSMCDNGSFRDDLYYRINVIPMSIPPLRERKEDIEALSKEFISNFSKLYNKFIILSDEAIKQLKEYPWPGNIRELKNVIERIAITSMSGDVQIIPDYAFSGVKKYEEKSRQSLQFPNIPELQNDINPDYEKFSYEKYMNEKEEELLRLCAEKFSTTVDIAKALKIDRTSIGRKLKKYNIKLKK